MSQTTFAAEHGILLARVTKVFGLDEVRSIKTPPETDGDDLCLAYGVPDPSVTGVDSELPGMMRCAKTYDVRDRSTEIRNLLLFEGEVDALLSGDACFLLVWSQPNTPPKHAPDRPILGVEFAWINPFTPNPYRAILRLLDALIEVREMQGIQNLLTMGPRTKRIFDEIDIVTLRRELAHKAAEIDIALTLREAPLTEEDGRLIFGSSEFDALVAASKLTVDDDGALTGSALKDQLFTRDQVALALEIDDPIKISTVVPRQYGVRSLSNGLWPAEKIERAAWTRLFAILAKSEAAQHCQGLEDYLGINHQGLAILAKEGWVVEFRNSTGQMWTLTRHATGMKELLRHGTLSLSGFKPHEALPLNAVCQFLAIDPATIRHLREQGIIHGGDSLIIEKQTLLDLRRRIWLLYE